MNDLIEFVVLQSVSRGWIDHAPGNLHLLLIGPPGHGKKLVGLAAKCLNPAFVELSPSKATPAGLVGASTRTPSGWKSTAGALPSAAHGVACLQDGQGWNGSTIKRVAPILQELMEDGHVRDSVAGGQRRAVPVSLLADMNRAEQVQLGASTKAEAALLSIRPLLSRFDAVVEIRRSRRQVWKVAEELAARIGARANAIETEAWVRQARLLVAVLRDAHPEIDLEPVRPLMQQVVKSLQDENADFIEQVEEASDIPIRLVINMARLTAASARACDRCIAQAEDVERARKFINHKLAFLRMNKIPDVPMSDSPDRSDRRAWVAREARDGHVRSDDLARRWTESTGEAVDERTMRRDLRALGAHRVAKGTYRLRPHEGATGEVGE